MQEITPQSKLPKPMSAMKHFWLSFLAVVTGVPVAGFILTIGWVFMTFIFFALVAASFPATTPSELPLVEVYGNPSASRTIVSVPIRGVILSGSAADPLQTLFGQSYTDGEWTKEQLRALAEDETVDAVILEIDSPGGMITASKALSDGVKYYKEMSGKPIYAHINGSGASGAYWVAASTDKISAEQGSEAGSIGVIMGPLVSLRDVVSYGDIGTRTPIGFKYYSAGRSKDLGNPFRDITPEEDAFINQQLAVEYEKFVAHVATERNIPVATIKNDIGALAYGTDDAKRLMLIDESMSKEDAYADLASAAGIENDYRVMRLDTTADFFGGLFGVQSFIRSITMSADDKSAGRVRFCETHFNQKPLVLSGDITSICQ